MSIEWKGVMPAVTTKFTKDDQLDLQMFETNVNDVSGVPYYVDMIVEHEDYGTVTSSVFNPGDSSDSKINGIFSQS